MVDPLKPFIIHLLVDFLRVTFIFRYFQLHWCHGKLHKGLQRCFRDASEMLEDGTGSGTKPDPRMHIAHAPCFPLSGSQTDQRLAFANKNNHATPKTDMGAKQSEIERWISPWTWQTFQGYLTHVRRWIAPSWNVRAEGLEALLGALAAVETIWNHGRLGCNSQPAVRTWVVGAFTWFHIFIFSFLGWFTQWLQVNNCPWQAFMWAWGVCNGLRIGHSRINSRNQRDMMRYLGMQDPFMPVLALEYHVVLLHCCTSQKRVHQCIVRVHHTSFLCPCNRKCWLTTVKQQIGLAVGRPSSPPSPTPVRVPEGWLTRLKRGGDARWRGWVPYRLSPSSMGFAWKWMGKMMIKHPTFRQDQLSLTTWIELGFWYQDFDQQIGQIGRHQNQWAWGNLSLWMSLASDFPAIFAELICWDQREGVTGGKHRQARWTGELQGGLVWVGLLVARNQWASCRWSRHMSCIGWFSGKTQRNAAYAHDPTTLLPKPCKHLFHPKYSRPGFRRQSKAESRLPTFARGNPHNMSDFYRFFHSCWSTVASTVVSSWPKTSGHRVAGPMSGPKRQK